MELKKTKQPVMGLAALFIILYHLFPVSRSNDLLSSSVRFIVMTGYIGVDIFFFMTGYMSHFSNTEKYFEYIKRKFLNIYPIFVLSCILFIMMGKLSIKRALLTLLGADLVMNGGGSFLWFIPAIMVFYLLVPFYKKLINKFGKVQTFIAAMVIWAIIMLVLENFLENHGINIFLCRIPIILIGNMAASYEGKWKLNYKLIFAGFFIITGAFLTWNFGYMVKASFLISDVFYIIAIPYVLGIVLLADVIFSKAKLSFFGSLGKMSLELYCFQMVFGALLFGRVFRFVNHSLLAFAITFLGIFILSGLMHTGRKRI